MASKGKCDKCKVKWHIRIMDQTPLKEMRCPECHGPVTPIYSTSYRIGCDYRLMQGEPQLGSRKRCKCGHDYMDHHSGIGNCYFRLGFRKYCDCRKFNPEMRR